MSLPEVVRNNPNIKRYIILPANETDTRHVVELWERKPHPSDIPASGLTPPLYYGEWQDRTAIAKAEWNLVMATNEMERLHREELKQRAKEQQGRSSLDGPIHAHMTK